MKTWFLSAALLFAVPALAKDAAPKPPGCKKVCSSKSQPCGNACISKSKVCHKPAGTACAAP